MFLPQFPLMFQKIILLAQFASPELFNGFIMTVVTKANRRRRSHLIGLTEKKA